MSFRNRVRGEGAFGTIIGLAILIVVGIALVKIVPIHYAGNKVEDAMNEQANFGGMKPLDKIAYDVFVVAQDAKTPLLLQDVKVSRQGSEVIIEAKYTQTVKVLGYQYTYVFDRTVRKPVF